MKTHTNKAAFSGAVAALALTVPGLGWAADHILSLTGIATTVCPSPGVTQVQAAVINGSGTVITPLILSGLQGNGSGCGAGSLNNNVNFTGTLVLERANVKLCKPGTKGGLEWLDQGSAVVGANGNLVTTVGSVTYQVAVPVGTVSTVPVSGPCTTAGADNVTVTRGATQIRKSTANNVVTLATASVATGAAGGIPTIPEPGTLSLMGMGLAGLSWMGMKRARKSRANAA